MIPAWTREYVAEALICGAVVIVVIYYWMTL